MGSRLSSGVRGAVHALAAALAGGASRCIDQRFNSRPKALWEGEEIGGPRIAAQAEPIRVDQAVSRLLQRKAGMARIVATFDKYDGLIRGDGPDCAPKCGSLVALNVNLDEIDRPSLRTYIINRH